MKITSRDVRLLRDAALSHVLSRDQILSLHYFGSVTRLNSRLRELTRLHLMKVIDTPFFNQHLYSVDRGALPVLGERISSLVLGRTGSPRFLQHALSVTNVRVRLTSDGSAEWFFEPQVTTGFQAAGRQFEVRPDGLARTLDSLTAVEVDLGHVSPDKFAEKLEAYDTFVASGACRRLWGPQEFRVLAVTTGPLRARRLRALCPTKASFDFECLPHDDLGISFPGSWS